MKLISILSGHLWLAFSDSTTGSLSRRERGAINEDLNRIEADRKLLDDDDFDAVIESARFRRQDLVDITKAVVEAELFFSVFIETAYVAGTKANSTKLTELLESLKEVEYTEGSTLDEMKFFAWTDPEGDFDVAKVDFTFAAKTTVTAESKMAVDDATFTAVASDIEDDLEIALKTLAKENDGSILPQNLDISENDFSEADICTENENCVYDTEVEAESICDEIFKIDDPTDFVNLSPEDIELLLEVKEIEELNDSCYKTTTKQTTTVILSILLSRFTNRITLLTCDDVIKKQPYSNNILNLTTH